MSETGRLHQIWGFLHSLDQKIDPRGHISTKFVPMYQHERAHIMAMPDPLSITIAPASAADLNKVSSQGSQSTFRSADGMTEATVAHTTSKKGRKRSVIRVDVRKVAPDLLLTGVSNVVSMGVQLIVDKPDIGFTPTEQGAIVDALTDILQRSTKANQIKFLTEQV